MTQEEDVIREGLIALLSVGDLIRYAVANQLSQQGEFHVIRECRVTKITGRTRFRIRLTNAEYGVYASDIHQCDGRLYVCNGLRPWSDDYQEILEELEKIVKSERTIWKYEKIR